KAHKAAHAQPRSRSRPAGSQRAIGPVDVRDEFTEIRAEIELAAFFMRVPGDAGVEARVLARHVSVHRDHDHGVHGHERGDLRDRVRAVVILLQRIAVAVAVKVIDYRISFFAALVIRWKKDAVIARFAEDFRWMGTIEKRPLRLNSRTGQE